MQREPEGLVSLNGIAAEIVSYRFGQPIQRVAELSSWSIGLWLSSRVETGEMGVDGEAMLPWSQALPISIAPPGKPMRLNASKGYMRGIVCRYEPDRFEELTGVTSDDWKHHALALASAGRSRRATLETALRTIAREIMTRRRLSELLIECLCIQAAIELGRLLRDDEPTERLKGGLAPWQIARIRHLLEEQPPGQVSVETIAEDCGLSPRHLSRAFKESMGMTLQKHIEEVRLERAQELLSRSTLSITQIATELGFAHASGLSGAFRRATGQSPHAFRQRFGAGIGEAPRHPESPKGRAE